MTFRDALLMANARRYEQWCQFGALWIAIAEPNRDSESRPSPFSLADIHPFLVGKQEDVAPAKLPALTALKAIYSGRLESANDS